LNRQIEQLIHGQRLAADLLVERHAFRKLHRDEVLTLKLVDLVDGSDIGMVQRRSRARLALLSAYEKLVIRISLER
jgi:hypothetical protein